MTYLRGTSLVIALAFLACVHARAAEQIELHLTSGQSISGELVSEDEGKIVVKSAYTTKSGKTMSMSKEYARSDIKEVVRLQDPEVEYAAKDGLAKTAAEHTALAQWCRDHQMVDHAVDHARKALTLEPNQEAATKLMGELGWILVADAWVKESDWLVSQGKVRYQGTIMTIAEADALKARQKLEQARKEAQQIVDDKTAALAALDRRLTDLPKRPAEIDTETAKDNTAMAAAQAAAQQVATAKAAKDAAESALTQAQAQAQAQSQAARPGSPAPPSDLRPQQQAVEDAQKAYNSAKRNAPNGAQDVSRLKAHLAALADEKKNLEKKAQEMKAERDALVSALTAAKAALADADQKITSAAPPGKP